MSRSACRNKILVDWMASQDDFNKLLLEFIDQLDLVFPEVPELSAYTRLAPVMVKSNPSAPTAMFLEATRAHSAKILTKDPTFFNDCPKLLNLDIKALWDKDLSSSTRDIIWAYIAHLHTLALTSTLPETTVAKLQDVAKDLMGQMESGTADMSQLLGMFQAPNRESAK